MHVNQLEYLYLMAYYHLPRHNAKFDKCYIKVALYAFLSVSLFKTLHIMKYVAEKTNKI